ncbi:nuclear transport factor 2 family protein [Minwuia sp.]|uniref:nuclear transport factor 2 family protein n=1 Tax=Minwuia sp. TaxID=2493630 RepID=UPI003A92D919
MSSEMDYARLKQLTEDFMACFNRDDLDGVMAYFAPEATYDQFDGTVAAGLDEVRAAFAPQFEGAFGEMRFEDEDMFIDERAGKVMVSWHCAFDTKSGRTGWRGLDLLHFNSDGQIVSKLTYAKAKTLKLAASGGQSAGSA